MLGQAAGFAVLAALSPQALLAVAVYLGSANPRRAMLIYLAGAVTMTVILAIVILVAIHAGGLNHPRQRQPRYGLRLGLGVLALGAGIFMARRKPKPKKENKKPSLVTRIMTHPAPIMAFAVGVLLFVPSASFIAAVQVIATAKASIGLIVLATAVVVIIVVAFVWLPFGFFLAAPDATTRYVRALDAWVQARSRVIIVGVLLLVGLLLVINGATGLA